MSKPSSRSASVGDQQVGARIRTRRRAVAMSQLSLGEKIGVSFRQVQKYEAGLNRISVTRLEQIAEALNVPLSELLGSESTSSPKISEFAQLPEADAFLEAYLSIDDPAARKQIVRLTVTLASLTQKRGKARD